MTANTRNGEVYFSDVDDLRASELKAERKQHVPQEFTKIDKEKLNKIFQGVYQNTQSFITQLTERHNYRRL